VLGGLDQDVGGRLRRQLTAGHQEVVRVEARKDPDDLSQHVESRFAVGLVGSGGGFGYLLKDRVLDVDEFLDAADRVTNGGSALDPEVVKQLLAPPQEGEARADLTPREREVLGLMAEGRTNAGIAKQLWLTEKTVETHVRSILGKLDLPPDGDTHRRVVAVLTYLRASAV
jgi:DNA-binding NarL/FixJ family response regulator